ncbi:hypothetical protein CPB85DRAFT_1252616 [Mucidula mucida]|nr:hypothetical protein CPB85DRAFT_1252616 [Mucidula mucida]
MPTPTIPHVHTQQFCPCAESSVYTFTHPLMLLLRFIDTLSTHSAPWAKEAKKALELGAAAAALVSSEKSKLLLAIRGWLTQKFDTKVTDVLHMEELIAFTELAARYYARFPQKPIWAKSLSEKEKSSVSGLTSQVGSMSVASTTSNSLFFANSGDKTPPPNSAPGGSGTDCHDGTSNHSRKLKQGS